MNLPELLKALDDALLNGEGHKAEEFQQIWLSIKQQFPESYWPLIEDRLELLFTKWKRER